MSRRKHRNKNPARQSRKPGKPTNPRTESSSGWLKAGAVLTGLALLVIIALLWRPSSPSQTAMDNTQLVATSKVQMATADSRISSAPEVTSQPGTNSPKPEQVAVELNQRATKLLDEGDPQGAIALYQKALALTPEDEDLHYNLGIAYAKSGDLRKAEEHYREALRILPDYAEVHNNLGNLLLRSGRLTEAEEQFTEALQLQPEYAAAHNNLGIVRQQQKRMADATACFQKAVQCDTNYMEAHFNLASAYLVEGKQDKAIPELQEALRIKPDFAPAQQALARATTAGP